MYCEIGYFCALHCCRNSSNIIYLLLFDRDRRGRRDGRRSGREMWRLRREMKRMYDLIMTWSGIASPDRQHRRFFARRRRNNLVNYSQFLYRPDPDVFFLNVYNFFLCMYGHAAAAVLVKTACALRRVILIARVGHCNERSGKIKD